MTYYVENNVFENRIQIRGSSYLLEKYHKVVRL